VGAVTLGGARLTGEIGQVKDEARFVTIWEEQFAVRDTAIHLFPIGKGVGETVGDMLEDSVVFRTSKAETPMAT
jgi:hypothetical protein